MNGTVWLAAALTLLGTGCESGGSAEPDGSASEEEEADDEPVEGGPVDDAAFDVGGVRTEAVESDTIELATRAPGEDESVEGGAWEPRLRIVLASAQREGEDVTVSGEAEYLHDEGGYALHSDDFEILVPKADKKTIEDPAEIPDEPPDLGDLFDVYTAAEPEGLATLTADEPSAEFAVTVSGVPPEDEAELNDLGNYGRMVRYVTPDELWGHTVEEPTDFVPGRVCYVEGDSWYDSELFPFTDLPCDS
ncbi:hypothetical protein F4561_004822 [Lipingzhangella halophila]|uniref:Uncharacterized protein n=1 Tax=Lipingzhangella halophila TaxID=1783352 RepID=A0A7W7W4C5_9ACTN|nr:hypothetical protein [Lipingzhangella halophila]MBB4934002.1 hypothetical protein [Lipingzhangella halophila]